MAQVEGSAKLASISEESFHTAPGSTDQTVVPPNEGGDISELSPLPIPQPIPMIPGYMPSWGVPPTPYIRARSVSVTSSSSSESSERVGTVPHVRYAIPPPQDPNPTPDWSPYSPPQNTQTYPPPPASAWATPYNTAAGNLSRPPPGSFNQAWVTPYSTAAGNLSRPPPGSFNQAWATPYSTAAGNLSRPPPGSFNQAWATPYYGNSVGMPPPPGLPPGFDQAWTTPHAVGLPQLPAGWGTPYNQGMNTPIIHPAENPWEISVIKAAQKYDADLSKGWKEDIDTLLVFAALFSAVVTAFTIESYRWLSEDPEDTMVVLLSLISRQLDGISNISETGSMSRPLFNAFNPSLSSALRINSFWFLSIITSLLSAFFGILCKQWLREHTRDTQTRSRAEALALRQLRNESFEKWGIPSMIATLPVLLELSLLLFFVGVLELLWILHIIPFIIAASVVGIGGGLYIITTFLPAITILRMSVNSPLANGKTKYFDTPAFHFICPFKSPQAWGVFTAIRRLIGALPSFPSLSGKSHWRMPSLVHKLDQASHWPSLDLHHVRQFDENPAHYRILHTPTTPAPAGKDLQVYELEGLRGLVNTFHDIPSMRTHLENILSTYEPSVVMAAVFNEWELCTWRTSPVELEDVKTSLHDLSQRTSSFADEKLGMSVSSDFALNSEWIEDDRAQPPPSPGSPLHSFAYVQLLYFQQYWTKALQQDESVPIIALKQYTDMFMTRTDVLQQTGIRFPIPFRAIAKLWTHWNSVIREQSIDFIAYYELGWKSCDGVAEKHDERFALIAALAQHILPSRRTRPAREDGPSVLIFSDNGLKLLQFINNEIISKKLYKSPRYNNPKGMTGIQKWAEAMRVVTRLRRLRWPDYFAPIPKYSAAHDLPDDGYV